MKKVFKTIKEYTWKALGVVYFPFYCLGHLLHMVARFLLGLSYYLMLYCQRGNDIMKSLFIKA